MDACECLRVLEARACGLLHSLRLCARVHSAHLYERVRKCMIVQKSGVCVCVRCCTCVIVCSVLHAADSASKEFKGNKCPMRNHRSKGRENNGCPCCLWSAWIELIIAAMLLSMIAVLIWNEQLKRNETKRKLANCWSLVSALTGSFFAKKKQQTAHQVHNIPGRNNKESWQQQQPHKWYWKKSRDFFSVAASTRLHDSVTACSRQYSLSKQKGGKKWIQEPQHTQKKLFYWQ